MDKALIDQYESQASSLSRWAAGLSPAELDALPIAGAWSVRQVIVHTLDSDLVATHRMRRIAAEELPLLVAYDETAFNKVPAIAGGDLETVCTLFALNRRWTAAFLRALTPESFSRAGVHTQRGKITIAELVPLYVHHVTHHERFVADKRRALGKPLA